VESIGRTDEDEDAATARVVLVLNDKVCTSIKEEALEKCVNLWRVVAPYVTEVCTNAFFKCVSLVEVILDSADKFGVFCFDRCFSLTYVSIPNTKVVGRLTFTRSDPTSHQGPPESNF